MSTETKYTGQIELAADFTEISAGFEANHIIIANDGSGTLSWSWSGQTGTVDGEVFATDGAIALDGIEKSKIFVKTSNPGDKARIWMWKGQA